MFWLKSILLTIQMVGMVGLCGMSSDTEELADKYEETIEDIFGPFAVHLETGQIEEIKTEEDDKYSSFLWKSWIMDEPISGDDDFGFVITKVNGQEIEGVIVIGHEAGTKYWIHSEMCKPFKGTVKENRAECTFQYEGCQAEATFHFQEEDRIEAAVKCDKMDIDMRCLFRPYRLSDIQWQWYRDLSSAPACFETWGEVNLISAVTDDNHLVPSFWIVDEQENILYEACCLNGFVFWDIFVEDLNQDGRQDIWAIIHHPITDGLKEGSFTEIFYQTEDGRFFQTNRGQGGGEPLKEHMGEYLVTRFCPTENYDDISETVLTQEEAEQMLGKEIVIQEELFVTYDSERRMGIREERKPPVRESLITEYRDSSEASYYFRPVLPDMSSGEVYSDAYLNESLREAVGEEYYDKIDGVFYNTLFAWQQFYTLENEDKLIMHSMLTGQNYILERKESDSKDGK